VIAAWTGIDIDFNAYEGGRNDQDPNYDYSFETWMDGC
jgi:hypothetical protein